MANAFDYVKKLQEMRGGTAQQLPAYQAPQPMLQDEPLHQRVAKLASLPNYTGGSTGASSIPDLAGIDMGLAPKGGAYTDQMRQAYALAKSLGVGTIGGYANRNIAGTNKQSSHARSRAWDFMVGNNKQFGDELASKYTALAPQLGIKYIIWHNQIWDPKRGWRPYKHPGGNSPTLRHEDHLHVEWD